MQVPYQCGNASIHIKTKSFLYIGLGHASNEPRNTSSWDSFHRPTKRNEPHIPSTRQPCSSSPSGYVQSDTLRKACPSIVVEQGYCRRVLPLLLWCRGGGGERELAECCRTFYRWPCSVHEGQASAEKISPAMRPPLR